ncbi:MAG: TMEM198/TM7SF3 family protein [Candidatus Hydrogenedentes bacterium]|nr:TMEM198/TM7SF3 family protein [Candidatus Hydrogenedentota bacterium]
MESLSSLQDLPETTLNGGVAIAIAVGTLYCFLGYRTLKVVISLLGFAIAGVTIGSLAAWAAPDNNAVQAGAAVIAGLMGAATLLFLYRVGVFLLGLLASALVSYALTAGTSDPNALWIVLGCALGGGAMALILERTLMILATAALGAWIVVCGVGFFLVGPKFLEIVQQPVELGKDEKLLLISWSTLAAAGILAQFATSKAKPREVVVTRE